MSVICRHFVQNSWRKDLCSNCFKSEEEHIGGGGSLSKSSAARTAEVLVGLDRLTRPYSSPQPKVPSYGAALTDLLGRPGSASHGGSLSLKSTAVLRGIQSASKESPYSARRSSRENNKDRFEERSHPENSLGEFQDETFSMTQLTESMTDERPSSGLTSSKLVQMVDQASNVSDGESSDAVDNVNSAVNKTLIRGILVLEKTSRSRGKRSIAFAEYHEVIGYGGEVVYEEDIAACVEQEKSEMPDSSDVLTATERQLWNLTKRNTDFNSIASNLSGTSKTLVDWVDENDKTTERSALTGRHKKFTPLVSIAPFPSARSPGGVKVNLVAPMKNGEVITESRREMVERRGQKYGCTDPKIAEKITRLDDLIDDKPRKTTSVEIGSEREDGVGETVSITEISGDDLTTSSKVETRLSFSIGWRRGETSINDNNSSPHPQGPTSLPATVREEQEVNTTQSNITRTNSTPVEEKSTSHSLRESQEPTPRARLIRQKTPLVVEQTPQPAARSSSCNHKYLPDEADVRERDQSNEFLDQRGPGLRKRSTPAEQSQGEDNEPARCTSAEADDNATMPVDKAPLVDGNEATLSQPRVNTDRNHGVSTRNDSMDFVKENESNGSYNGSERHVNDNEKVEADTKKELSPDSAIELARLAARSAALQKLIDADVDNKKVEAPTSKNVSDEVTTNNKINLIRSRFADNSNLKKDTKTSTGACNQPKSKLFSSAKESAKPSPRASFLHSLTSSREDEANNGYDAFLATQMSDENATKPNFSDAKNTHPAPPLIVRPGAHKERLNTSTDALIKAASKPAGGSPKPPIVREKPKIAAKPARLHRLSRTTSEDSDSSSGSSRAPSEPRDMTPVRDIPAPSVEIKYRQAEIKLPEPAREVLSPSSPSVTHTRVKPPVQKTDSVSSTTITDSTNYPMDEAATGPVCVEVTSPVLDASTRLSKLVESVSRRPITEPQTKSHITISLPETQIPARKESMTKKEWAMHREKELERQRHELEKKNEESSFVTEPKPVAEKEVRMAPQPPLHQQLERTVSCDFEANRAVIANLFSMSNRGSVTKRQAPRAPENGQHQETEKTNCETVKKTLSPSSSIEPMAPLKEIAALTSEPSDRSELTEASPLEKQVAQDNSEKYEDNDNIVNRNIDPDASQGAREVRENTDDSNQEKSSRKDLNLGVSPTQGHFQSNKILPPENHSINPLEDLQQATSGGLLEEVAELVGLTLSEKPFSDDSNPSKAPEDEQNSKITLKVESAVSPSVSMVPSTQKVEEIQSAHDLSSREPPMSLPVAPTPKDSRFAVKDDTNPYASSAIFQRRSSFRPEDKSEDDDEDLPPSASMRASSVSPRSRKRARNATLVSFDPGAEFYCRDNVVPVQPRSQSMPRGNQLTEVLMTDEELKKKIYGVSSAGTVYSACVVSGERKSRRDEPKRRGKFSLKKFLKFGGGSNGGKDDKKKEHRVKPEIIHPLDLTPGSGKVEVIVRTEEEKRRDEEERQRKKALLIAEGTRVYDSPYSSKTGSVRLPELSAPSPTSSVASSSAPSTACGSQAWSQASAAASATTPSSASTPTQGWQQGALGFNSEGRPKPPPPPRRTSSIDQSETLPLAQAPPTTPTRARPPTLDGVGRSSVSSDKRDSVYANLGSYRAGLTPRKPDRGGSVRHELPKQLQPPCESPADVTPADDVTPPQATAVEMKQPAPPVPSGAISAASADTSAATCTNSADSAAAAPPCSSTPRQRASRVSLRKQSSVVHSNLEENYDAVTASNHEALSQLLDQVTRRRPVPSCLSHLEHNPALAFTHFRVSAESHVTCGRRAFLAATHRDQEVLLMLSSEPAAVPAASLPPVAQFRDLVQGHLLPKASTGSYTSAMQATVWVFAPLTISPLWEVICAYPPVTSEEQEQGVCLLLLQTFHHLLELQMRGQEFVDQTLCELVVATSADDPESRLVAVYGNSAGRERLTACQAALVVMLRMLGVQDALERVRDGRGVSVPEVPSLNAFELLANLLLREDACALKRARAVLEFLLWGPADRDSSGAESSLQRWLDLERATLLNNLIRTQKLWSVELSVTEEFRLMFLVQTDAAVLHDASALLEI